MELKIIDVGINGEGIAKKNDSVFFVPHALKNEIVNCEILKTKGNLNFCKIIDFVQKSPERVDAPCIYYGNCGGCDLQHTIYENQLNIKTQNVKITLEKALHQKLEVQNTKPSEKTFEYRNKIEMPIKNGKVGFYQKNSHDVIFVENCLICENWCKNVILAMNEYLQNVETKNFKHLVARYLENEILIIIVTKNMEIPKQEELFNIFSKYFKNYSIFQNINDKNHAEILGKKYIKIYGNDTQKITDNMLECEISPQSFMQVNNNVKHKLYADVLNFVEKHDIVVNAYSGAGYLTAMLAQKCKKAYGVEIDKNATKNADKLMQKNNIKNVENICGDCVFALPKLLEKLENNEKNGKILEKNTKNTEKIENNSKNLEIIETNNKILVLDPARKGIDAKVLNLAKTFGFDKIIYISCYPATLARDLQVLQEKYEVNFVQPYDMFPQTKHVETMVVLNKIN